MTVTDIRPIFAMSILSNVGHFQQLCDYTLCRLKFALFLDMNIYLIIKKAILHRMTSEMTELLFYKSICLSVDQYQMALITLSF